MFLKRVHPAWYYRDAVPDDVSVRLRYLGTAGFVVEGEGRTLVLDPFLTRPGLWTTLFRPLVPNAALLQQVIPRADDVIIGHAHHDHVLDAPVLCQQTGARFIGSVSACHVARAAGLPESQILETQGREWIACGTSRIRGLPSLHGRVYFNYVPLKGEITTPPPWPPRYRQLRHGLVLNWYIEIAGVRIVHIDSADFLEEELEGLQADVVCMCAIGRKYRKDYVKRAIEILRPRYILPCHWDWFFSPYFQEPRCLPAVDLQGMIQEIESFGVSAILLPFEGVFGL